MNIRRYLTRSNALGALFGVTVLFGQLLDLYGKWWPFDNLMHALSGVALGSLVASSDSPQAQDVLIVTGLGVVWEFFEFHRGIHPWDEDTDFEAAANDTFTDMVLVVIGAVVGSRLAKDN